LIFVPLNGKKKFTLQQHCYVQKWLEIASKLQIQIRSLNSKAHWPEGEWRENFLLAPKLAGNHQAGVF
jgi:hypothetical protein